VSRIHRAATVLLVVLTLAGCGRATAPPDAVPASASPTGGASPAAIATTAPAAREDEPTATATVPGLAELEAALGTAEDLADEVEQDLAEDDS